MSGRLLIGLSLRMLGEKVGHEKERDARLAVNALFMIKARKLSQNTSVSGRVIIDWSQMTELIRGSRYCRHLFTGVLHQISCCQVLKRSNFALL